MKHVVHQHVLDALIEWRARAQRGTHVHRVAHMGVGRSRLVFTPIFVRAPTMATPSKHLATLTIPRSTSQPTCSSFGHHLEHPGLQVAVQKHVETKQLVAWGACPRIRVPGFTVEAGNDRRSLRRRAMRASISNNSSRSSAYLSANNRSHTLAISASQDTRVLITTSRMLFMI